MNKMYRGFVTIKNKNYTISICKDKQETHEYMKVFCMENGIQKYNIQEVLVGVGG